MMILSTSRDQLSFWNRSPHISSILAFIGHSYDISLQYLKKHDKDLSGLSYVSFEYCRWTPNKKQLSRREVFYKKAPAKRIMKFTWKHTWNRVPFSVTLQASARILHCMCFFVNFAKFFRTANL